MLIDTNGKEDGTPEWMHLQENLLGLWIFFKNDIKTVTGFHFRKMKLAAMLEKCQISNMLVR